MASPKYCWLGNTALWLNSMASKTSSNSRSLGLSLLKNLFGCLMASAPGVGSAECNEGLNAFENVLFFRFLLDAA